MKPICVYLRVSAVAFAVLAFCAAPAPAQEQGNAKRGAYLAAAGGCLGCHTEAKDKAVPYAGGRALKTPFGTFYGPNITPDPKAGIGKWSEADFIRAMRHGRRPDGANYYPAFPYPSFTRIREGDLRDLWAYLQSLPPSSKPSRPHELGFFYRWRFLITIWKWLYFTPGAFGSVAGASEVVNRGAYLVQALGHCGECHTPRNFLGGPKSGRYLAGGKGPEGDDVPNLTPTGLKKWSDRDLQQFLVAGMTPDGDFPSEDMAQVVNNTTSKLTPQDLAALVAYLRWLPPLPD
jgi:mono/diheme cytochrome c family protein